MEEAFSLWPKRYLVSKELNKSCCGREEGRDTAYHQSHCQVTNHSIAFIKISPVVKSKDASSVFLSMVPSRIWEQQRKSINSIQSADQTFGTAGKTNTRWREFQVHTSDRQIWYFEIAYGKEMWAKMHIKYSQWKKDILSEAQGGKFQMPSWK